MLDMSSFVDLPSICDWVYLGVVNMHITPTVQVKEEVNSVNTKMQCDRISLARESLFKSDCMF